MCMVNGVIKDGTIYGSNESQSGSIIDIPAKRSKSNANNFELHSVFLVTGHIVTKKTNKTGTSQVGAIPKAQKAQTF